ncbi:hypothetical protein tinsulaeT_22820 [Thalassotalea insulae]|uniref:Uncharacterized protein n=1 Tax=Thalassotalea insulae TaxID=2056778 RepID=A0ABQ6GSQ6_9GAMM|nr:hypothetical protein [Thalassotalea insulae]GLX78942.1 hypothetical protein tinsulaeT_22820 [Thalassotalea insulae]
MAHWPNSDIYFKGALFINTLRHIVQDDEKWWAGVKSFTLTFKKQILTTVDVLNFFNDYFDYDFEKTFDQYLYFNHLPVLETREKENTVEYWWKSDVAEFDMPIDVIIDGQTLRLYPTVNKQKFHFKSHYKIETNKFYIKVNLTSNVDY